MRTYIHSLDLALAAQLVLKLQNNLGRRLTPGAHAAVLIYLAVTIQALHDGKPIKAASTTSIAGTPEHRVAHMLLQEVSSRLQLGVSEPEANVLAACLLGSEWERPSSAPVSDVLPPGEPSPEALEYSRQIVQACAAQLHPFFKIDHELIKGMAFHLDPVLHRLRHGIPVWNPHLETVRNRYADVYRSAAEAVRILEQDLGNGGCGRRDWFHHHVSGGSVSRG